MKRYQPLKNLIAALALTAFAMRAFVTLAPAQQAEPSKQLGSKQIENGYHSVPAAWTGEWDGISFDAIDPSVPKDVSANISPLSRDTDKFIIAHLQPWAKAKLEATPYDGSPGSLCDPEGWFPFINYNYGFALLDSPGKITLIPVEADTEGIRRIYVNANHPREIAPTWNGNSIARWEDDTLVVDTVGFNALSWLGDEREPHTTALHMIERMRLVHEGKYLEVIYEFSDPEALTSSYKLTRYFVKFNASHIGAGPDRSSAELVCNEDASPFMQEGKKAAPKVEPQK